MRRDFKMRISFTSFLIPLLITAFTGTLNKINAQTRVGIQAGYNISDVLMEDRDGNKNPTKPISGFHIGFNVDIPVAKNFYVQPVFEYITKGFEQNDNYFFGSDNETKVRASYIQLPVNFIYEFKIHKGKLYVGAGPYVGYGTGGKWKSKSDVLIGDIRIENHGDVNFKEDSMDGEFGVYLYGKPWELGSNLLVGYQFFDRFKLQINNKTGMSNLQPETGGQTEGGVLKNRVYSFSLAYTF